jgi:DNA or RNA helicases of superfamily II
MSGDLFEKSRQQLGDLNTSLEQIHELVAQREGQLTEYERELTLTGIDPSSFQLFMKKPYMLRPIKEDRYELIVPRFLDLGAGWPARQDGEYNIFLVSRFIDLIAPLPEWLRKDLNFEKPPHKVHLDGDWLVVDGGDPNDVWRSLGGGKRFSARDGSRLRIVRAHRFQVLRDLIRQGVLPYTPQPVSAQLLRAAGENIVLREKQQRDFETFLQLGAVSVFATGGAGKTYFGMYAMDRICGPKVVLAPRKSILEQWEARLRAYCPRALDEVEFRTYQSLRNRPLNGHYNLIVYDEIQHMPAEMGLRAAQVDSASRIGLSATPWREDGNEDLIPALCGQPVGVDWPSGAPAETTVWLVGSETDKFNLTEQLASQPTSGKTMIFVYRLDIGERLAKRLNVPFIHGATSNQYEKIQAANTFVISKVGDAGISINATRVIELDWLGGRAEAGQRALRTQHADERGELHIIMTREEYRRSSSRLAALAALHFDVKIVSA